MSLANRLIYAEGQVIAFEGQFFDADFRPIPNANPGTKRTKRQMDGIRVGGRDLVAHLRQRRFRQPSSYNAVSEPPTGIREIVRSRERYQSICAARKNHRRSLALTENPLLRFS